MNGERANLRADGKLRQEAISREINRINNRQRHRRAIKLAYVLECVHEPLRAGRVVADDRQTAAIGGDEQRTRGPFDHRFVAVGQPLRLPRGATAQRLDHRGSENSGAGAFAQPAEGFGRSDSIGGRPKHRSNTGRKEDDGGGRVCHARVIVD